MTHTSVFKGAALSLAVLGAGLGAVTGCSKPAAPPPLAEAGLDDVETLFARALERPSGEAAGDFDAEALKGFLSPWGELTYASAGADAASGAYKLSDVTFKPKIGDANVSMAAEEVLFWNFDLDAIEARLEGRRLEETLKVFDRIELTGFSAEMTDLTGLVTDMMPDDVTEAINTNGPQQDIRMSAARIIQGGLTLHPWTLTATEGESEDIRAIRLVSAWMRNFSLDTSVMLDARVEQTANDAAFNTSSRTVYPRQLMSGYDRGNVAAMIQTGTEFDTRMSVTDADVAASFPGFSLTGEAAYSAWNGLKLAPLLEWGERGEMPPFAELNDWAIGSYLTRDVSMSMDGTPVFTVGEAAFSAERFSWFFPEEITFSYSGASLDLGGITSAVARLQEASGEAAPSPSPLEVAGMLERSGLSKISADGELQLTWNPDTGQTRGQSRTAVDGLYKEDWNFDIGLPSMAHLEETYGKDGLTPNPDPDAMETLFAETFSLTGAQWRLTDTGLLQAVSMMVIELAKLEEGSNPMLAGFADGTPESVRAFAAGGVMVGSGEVAKELPEARDWLMKLSEFIKLGGEITVQLAPEQPVTAASLEALDTGGMTESDPSAIVRLLGLSVTHTPPPGAAQP